MSVSTSWRTVACAVVVVTAAAGCNDGPEILGLPQAQVGTIQSCGTSVPAAHPTIQAAINAVASGTVICVTAGTYAQGSASLTVNKSVTIQGSGTVIISGTAPSLIQVTAPGVTLNGLTVQPGADAIAVQASGNADGLTIQNVIFNGGSGSSLAATALMTSGATGGMDGLTFHNNTVQNFKRRGISHFDGASASTWTIKGNTFSGTMPQMIQLGSATTVAIEDNVFQGPSTGPTGNSGPLNYTMGILLAPPSIADIRIQGNNFTNLERGVDFHQGTVITAPTKVRILNNRFIGMRQTGLQIRGAESTPALYAGATNAAQIVVRDNWFATGTGHLPTGTWSRSPDAIDLRWNYWNAEAGPQVYTTPTKTYSPDGYPSPAMYSNPTRTSIYTYGAATNPATKIVTQASNTGYTSWIARQITDDTKPRGYWLNTSFPRVLGFAVTTASPETGTGQNPDRNVDSLAFFQNGIRRGSVRYAGSSTTPSTTDSTTTTTVTITVGGTAPGTLPTDPTSSAGNSLTVGTPLRVYAIHTTGTTSSNDVVCLNYEPTEFPTGAPVRLWALNGTGWSDITSAANNTGRSICGRTQVGTSGSPTTLMLGYFPNATTIFYSGVTFTSTTSVTPKAQVTPAACLGTSPNQVTFSLTDVFGNPVGGTITANTGTAGGEASGPAVSGLAPGMIYSVAANYTDAQNPDICYPADDLGTVTITDPNAAVNGGGWYRYTNTDGGTPKINVGFTVRDFKKKGETIPVWRGHLLWTNAGKWRVQGSLTNFGVLSSTACAALRFDPLLPAGTTARCGAASGTATILRWNSTQKRWTNYSSGTGVTITFLDAGTTTVCTGSGKNKKCTTSERPDYFAIDIAGQVWPQENGGTLVELKGGSIVMK